MFTIHMISEFWITQKRPVVLSVRQALVMITLAGTANIRRHG